VLHQIDREKIRPQLYKTGSRGPEEADAWINNKSGYLRNDAYVWYDGNICLRSGF
jgi:glucose-6-phosphate 1-dehydrogenase